MDHKQESNEKNELLPFNRNTKTGTESGQSALEFPEAIKNGYTNLLTIEDEYEGLTSGEASHDVEQCNELLMKQEQQIQQLVRKLNQEKSKLERLKGDLEEAEVCQAMAQSYEAAITGWREMIQIFEAHYQSTLQSQQGFSIAEQAWDDLKHVEQQAITELENKTRWEVIHTPYGSTTVPKQEGLLPDEITVEVLGDYLPVSLRTETARLALTQCQQGTATFAVSCL
ncbi:hypothetical protein [Gimesia sp.]|uniref:hypothetical protein n=1 Tax=Gimesia sp. TaxID=2024833 RepID=UPI000C52E93B|nr:hypothetical protein [Gimesia sp.]MAX35715.1 hypothetical protein [Gimesia sp.]HAH45361.1 hypothetical protein [Planctomycetaceae bacterium]HBL47669.1 hypothetical protein [Planctomycetaceae bacterium]|tara:strand:- start:4180 stop:4860 length:681 start_codon:yes stop_codon:yes gene_type:complete